MGSQIFFVNPGFIITLLYAIMFVIAKMPCPAIDELLSVFRTTHEFLFGALAELVDNSR